MKAKMLGRTICNRPPHVSLTRGQIHLLGAVVPIVHSIFIQEHVLAYLHKELLLKFITNHVYLCIHVIFGNYGL